MYFLYEHHPYPCVDAEQGDEQRLHRVHDEHEIERLFVGYAIEDEHRFHGEVPRTGTVWRGNDDGDAAHDEGDEGARQPQVGGEVEAEKRQVVVHEVRSPYRERQSDEQPRAPHVFQRDDTLPDSTERLLYIIIYIGRVLTPPLALVAFFQTHLPDQPPQKHHSHDATQGGDNPSGSGELGEETADAGACLREEIGKDGQLDE